MGRFARTPCRVVLASGNRSVDGAAVFVERVSKGVIAIEIPAGKHSIAVD